jgi:hypothetical protein
LTNIAKLKGQEFKECENRSTCENYIRIRLQIKSENTKRCYRY